MEITTGSQNISDKAYQQGGDDESGGKKKVGSSHKDHDDDSQENANVLGIIEIETVYFGTSHLFEFEFLYRIYKYKKII